MIKLAFFDFDETLIIHKRRQLSKDYENTRMVDMINEKDIYYNSYVPNQMIEFVRKLKENNVKIYCLSHEYNNISYKAKKEVIDKYYQNCFEDVIIVGQNEEKNKVMDYYAKALNLKHDEILFCDDKAVLIMEACDKNFIGIMATEVFTSNIDDLIKEFIQNKTDNKIKEKIITDDKVAHMHGVAEYMYNNAEKYNLDKEEMYILGFLHDIGYLFGKDNHPQNGATLLERLGFNFYEFVKWHGKMPDDYIKFMNTNNIPNELRLLLEADLSISKNGQNIGFKERLIDIGNRYGFDSEIYNIAKETINFLSMIKI